MNKKSSLALLIFLTCCLADISATNKKWWEHATIYQIYPRSFQDSDGDGIGDLVGITSRLNHLADIGVNTIWMSPMFQSPLKDFGYDVSDFYKVHDEYGTMADFDNFLQTATNLGINVLLDFVPNHSSDQCEWFVQSLLRNPDYDEFYTWHDGYINEEGDRIPPNNWVRVIDPFDRNPKLFCVLYRDQCLVVQLGLFDLNEISGISTNSFQNSLI